MEIAYVDGMALGIRRTRRDLRKSVVWYRAALYGLAADGQISRYDDQRLTPG